MIPRVQSDFRGIRLIPSRLLTFGEFIDSSHTHVRLEVLSPWQQSLSLSPPQGQTPQAEVRDGAQPGRHEAAQLRLRYTPASPAQSHGSHFLLQEQQRQMIDIYIIPGFLCLLVRLHNSAKNYYYYY